MRRLLPPQRAKTARRGARLAAIGLLAALIVSAFALARKPIDAQAASNAGNLTLASVTNGYSGCPLGPGFTFCDQAPTTASQPVRFFINSSAAVTGAAVSLQAVPGLTANFAAGDFTIASNTCTGNIAANAQCEIDVEFSPTMTGLRQATLAITDSQGDLLSINVQGTGNNLALAPPFGISLGVPDNSFNFGAVASLQTSPSQSFTVTAGGSLTQISVSFSAIPGLESEFASGGTNGSKDFSLSDNCGALAAGGTCTVSVNFSPSAVGLRSAALVATDAQGDSSTVYVSGYGSNGNGGTQSGGLAFSFAAASASATSCARVNYFGFCNMPDGGVSASSTFTLQNASTAQVTGLTVPTGSVFAQGATASDFTVKNTSCTSVLAAGATCGVSVAFTPTKSGLRQGAIVITDAQGDVAAINLAGVGDDYNIVTQLPTEVSAIPGATATFNATLTPDDVFGMNGEQVTFVCPENLPASTSCVATPCPATITPGAPVSVKVTLVTSSALIVAPIPPPGCSSYGPSLAAIVRAPGGDSPVPPAAGTGASRASPLYPALLIFATFGALGLLVAIFALPGTSASRKRMPLVFACAGLAAAILTGCHHHSATVTTATPTGATTMTVLGNAVDASGNSLNTSRQFQVTLDVVSQ